MKQVRILVAFSATVNDDCDVSKLSIEIPNATQVVVHEINHEDPAVFQYPIVGKVDGYETIDVDDSEE